MTKEKRLRPQYNEITGEEEDNVWTILGAGIVFGVMAFLWALILWA